MPNDIELLNSAYSALGWSSSLIQLHTNGGGFGFANVAKSGLLRAAVVIVVVDDDTIGCEFGCVVVMVVVGNDTCGCVNHGHCV